jgi:hypothetical protein
MKRRLPALYYLVPAVYVVVIGFFVFMQFRAREGFQDNLGALVVSGSYSKSLSGGRRIREVTVSCNGVRLRFGRRALLLTDLDPARARREGVLAYARSAQGVQLTFGRDLRLQFTLRGDSVVLQPLVPADLSGLRVLSLPLELRDERAQPVRGIPLLRLAGRSGVSYAALPAGSKIDLKNARLEVNLAAAEGEPLVVFDRVQPDGDEPFLYWFSRSGPLVDEAAYRERLSRYLDKAYSFWSRLAGNPDDPAVADELGACLLSEAARRGDYRRLLPAVVAAVVRARELSGPAYRVAAYVGLLRGYQSIGQQRAAELIPKATEAIRRSDAAILGTPELMQTIVNRGPFSLAEETLRLADSVDRGSAPISTLVDLLGVYLEAAEMFDDSQPTRQKVAELVDAGLLPAVQQAREGLFLTQPAGEQAGRVDVEQSVRTGRLLVRAAGLLSRPSLALLGRNLLASALALSDSDGFVPAKGAVKAGRFRPEGAKLRPEKLYAWLAEDSYLPREYTLYRYLSPGVWLYTAARPLEMSVEADQYRFSFGFPAGDQYYFILQGIRPMKTVMMHGILWKPDPQYYLYSDGWLYDPESQTFYGKITPRQEREEIVLSY